MISNLSTKIMIFLKVSKPYFLYFAENRKTAHHHINKSSHQQISTSTHLHIKKTLLLQFDFV